MRSDDDVRRVFELWDQGLSKKAIARETGVSRTQVRGWLARGLEATLDSPMRRTCEGGGTPCDLRCGLRDTVDPRAYAYLLGMYLGDGCISAGRRNVYKLRVSMCDAYPDIRSECEAAIRAVMPDRRIGSFQREGCTEIYSHSKHWPCLFPQHGPGRKHTRPIMLSGWQERIVYDRFPDRLLRGLIQSDGSRCINRVTSMLKSGLKQYEYPRYTFKNESGHILGIFTHACQLLGIDWRWDGVTQISIARRESVARLDSFVGPKS